jgi:hypothetical protein
MTRSVVPAAKDRNPARIVMYPMHDIIRLSPSSFTLAGNTKSPWALEITPTILSLILTVAKGIGVPVSASMSLPLIDSGSCANAQDPSRQPNTTNHFMLKI